MLYKFALFFLLILPFEILAQIDSFHIANYARPDLERRTLSITGDFELDNSNSEQNVDAIEGSSFFRPQLSLSHNALRNTAKVQKSLSNSASTSFSYNKQKISTDSTTKNLRFYTSYRHDSSIKKFYSGQRFLELIYDADFSYEIDRDKDEPSYDISKTEWLNSSFSIAPYLGKGRIELVSDAWHAKTILQILEEAGFINKVITAEEIQAFAEQISSIKNMRNTDNRLEDITEFETLCAFLIDHKIVAATDFNFFALLHDAWRYEGLMSNTPIQVADGFGVATDYLALAYSAHTFFLHRYHGKEFKVGLSPSIGITDYRTLNRTFSPSGNLLIRGILAYNTFKAISDNWQFNNLNQLTLGLRANGYLKREETESYGNGFLAELRSTWTIQYLPSRRTNYSLSLNWRYNNNASNSFSYNKRNDTLLSSSYSKSNYVNLALQTRVNHYFSPRFNLAIRLSLSLDFNDNSARSSFISNNLSSSKNSAWWNAFDIRMNYSFY